MSKTPEDKLREAANEFVKSRPKTMGILGKINSAFDFAKSDDAKEYHQSLRPVDVPNDLEDMAKKAVGFDRQVELFGRSNAVAVKQMWMIGYVAGINHLQQAAPLPTCNELDLIRRVNDAEAKYDNAHRMLMEYMHLVESHVGFAGPIESVKESLDKLIQKAALESDAVHFADWILKEQWIKHTDGKYSWWGKRDSDICRFSFQLYTEYKKSKTNSDEPKG